MLDSVRTRLTIWYSAVLAAVLLLVSATTYLIVRKTSMQRTDTELAVLADSFVVTFEDELADEAATGAAAIVSAAHQSMIEHRSDSDAFAVVASDGRVIATSNDSSLSNVVPNSQAARALSSWEFQAFATQSEARESSLGTIARPRFRAYARHFKAGDQSLVLVVLHSLHTQNEVLETIRAAFAWMILLGLLLAGTGGYFLARKSLAPVVAMGAQAKRIGASNLHDRLPVQNPNDELGQLANIFNDLLNRLDQSFERQRRFIADASHELRTPLAILRGEAEVAMSQPGRQAREYLESVRVLHDETSRLIKIVEDLFTLSRADSGQYNLSFDHVYLEEVAADCAHSARTLAREKNIELRVDASAECPVRGDPSLLRRMILNLLDNAIKYTPDGGSVAIECRAGNQECEIHVIDTGTGIPAELQSRIFERFFRADPARSRAGREGGAGLGLSIAQWIAEAHHGRLKLVHSDAQGTHFAVYLPLHQAVSTEAD